MMLKIFDLHSTSNLRGKGNRNINDFWFTAWTSCFHAVKSNFKDPDQLKKKKKNLSPRTRTLDEFLSKLCENSLPETQGTHFRVLL